MSKNDFLPDGTIFSSHSRNGSSTHAEASSESSHNPEITDQKIEKSEELNVVEKPIPPSKPPSPAPTKAYCHIQHSVSNLNRLLREGGCNEIPNSYDLRVLWSADRDPPITKEKLGELDLDKLYENLYLRHDLNFDRHIHFSPRNQYDSLGRQKRLEGERYWEAVKIELMLHISHLESLHLGARRGSSPESYSILPAPSALGQMPLRLGRLMRHICRIIATLVPFSMEASVKTRLNYKMFTQELEHGQCDIEGLFTWIGTLLLQSCAPSRDVKINDMIETMGQGHRNRDPHLLCRGLQDLSLILEIMKLVNLMFPLFLRNLCVLTHSQDATNYQFQLHRNHMLMHSVEAEQKQLLMCMKSGWEVPNWLTISTSSGCSFESFVKEAISIITEPSDWTLPTALTLDFSRIHHLRSTFQHLTLYAACHSTLNSVLQHLGHPSPLPPSSTNKITDLVTALGQESPFLNPSTDQVRHESLILAIANLASSHSTPPHLPTLSTISHTRQTFYAAIAPHPPFPSPPTTSAKDIADTLAGRLRTAVAAELKEVDALNLTASGLASRYTTPPSSKRPLCSAVASLKQVAPGLNSDAKLIEAKGLEEMARRIAHMAVLHWRVWAPLLYMKESEGGKGVGASVSREEPLVSVLSSCRSIECADSESIGEVVT